MSWIEWCKCHRRILTTGQQNEGKPCDICQEEIKHAQRFPERFKELGERSEEDVK